MRKIYIASSFENRDALRPVRDRLWEDGHVIVSTWLDETKKPIEMPDQIFWSKLGRKDLAEIQSADLFILDNRTENTRGGKNVEFGYALGRHQQIEIWIIGPVRNVFQPLADRHFESWDDCFSYMHSETQES